jgi:transcriptional regulator with GAF, ATPase, and Fis domain
VLIGRSREFAEILRLVDLAASTDAPVLITGETGTGKTVVAKAIHYKSHASKEAFIPVNCSALPENLIESELFGYEKGAFTGAVNSRKGIFEMAEGGTLFLDEIGEMPSISSDKTPRCAEDKKIKRLGGDFIQPVNVRFIAATSADRKMSWAKHSGSDLFFRLSVIRIHIPPLRERRQDIQEICTSLEEDCALQERSR